MVNQLEHASISVKSIARTLEFLAIALPNYVVRGSGGEGSSRWVHVGCDETYLALVEDRGSGGRKGPGLNHLGFVVDDADALCDRLEEAGYREGQSPAIDHPHRKRVYYVDGNGLLWEFVQYYSDDPAERNDYSC